MKLQMMNRLVAVLAAVVVSVGAMATAVAEQPSSSGQLETAIFAGGCFWCVETDFEHAPGVVDVVSGYSGGTTENPTYHNYHDGHHTEVVQVSYDPTKVTYAGLVEWLIKHIDPTDPDGQFYDRGDGYKPVVYYASEAEQAAAQRVIEAIDNMKIYRKPLAVEVAPRQKFYPAEDYHQDYHRKEPVHYKRFRTASGRQRLTTSVWGRRLNTLELPGAYPEGVVDRNVR